MRAGKRVSTLYSTLVKKRLQKVTINRILRLIEAAGLVAEVKVKEVAWSPRAKLLLMIIFFAQKLSWTRILHISRLSKFAWEGNTRSRLISILFQARTAQHYVGFFRLSRCHWPTSLVASLTSSLSPFSARTLDRSTINKTEKMRPTDDSIF